MKKIGITQRLVKDDKHGEIRSALDIKWAQYLISRGLVPVPLAIGVDIQFYADLELSGFILTGGNDLLSQSTLGSQASSLSRIRDESEFALMQYAVDHSIPVIGICRGMQVIAEFFGSTLKRVDNHVARHHEIEVQDSDWISKELSRVNVVNSYHHAAIDELASGLKINAICPEDDVIESVSHETHRIYGQMWHPERDNPFNDDNGQLISNFF